MGAMIGLAIGYVMGTRAGEQGYDELQATSWRDHLELGGGARHVGGCGCRSRRSCCVRDAGAWPSASRCLRTATCGSRRRPMRFVDEYRDPAAARALIARITDVAGDEHFKFMEVCGGHTHTIYRHGIEHVLPEHGRAGARARVARCASSRWVGSTTRSRSRRSRA